MHRRFPGEIRLFGQRLNEVVDRALDLGNNDNDPRAIELTGLSKNLIRIRCSEMTDSCQQINGAIKEFILAEFLPGEPAENLDDSTPLIEGAIVDSIGIMKLVLFIDEKFGIEIEPHEMSAEFLGTIADIVKTVNVKIAQT